MSHLFDDLIGRWPLNDDSGNGSWLSTAPLSNHFVGVGGPQAATGHSSASATAIGFNPTSQYLEINPGSLTGFDTSSNYTIGMFFRVNSFPSEPMFLFSLWDNTGGDKSFALLIDPTQKLKFFHSTDGTTVHSLSSTLTVGAVGMWHHLFVEQDTNKIRMYLDNSLIGSGPVLGPLHQASSAFLRLGKLVTNQGSILTFNGQADDIIVWSRALNQSERNEVAGLGTDFMTKHANPGLPAKRHELILNSDRQVVHYMKRNDLQPHFFFHCLDEDFNDIDITSHSIQVNMAHVDSGTIVVSAMQGVTFVDTVNGDNATTGKGHYTWGSSDTIIAGKFRFELELTPPLGGKFTLTNNGNICVVVNSDVINH